MAPFAFDYPDTFGFTSGWNEKFNPDGSYRLTKRTPLWLRKWPAKSILTGESGTVFLKTRKKTDLAGLSSGAGSSLYRIEEGNVLKIKRNGYFNSGAIDETYSLSDISFNTYSETTKTFFKRGTMDRKTAETEFKMLSLLHNEGFCPAMIPKDILVYELPGSNEKAFALICQVQSDLRLDEFIFALYSEHLKRQINSQKVLFSPKTGLFAADKYLIADGLKDTQLLNDLQTIGGVLGTNYREFHEAGFLRGYPHSWFGNETVDKNGEISFVDLEFSHHSNKLDNRFKQLQEIERFQAQSALFSEFETLSLHFFAIGAKELVKGFIQGYDKKTARTIPAPIIQRALINYKKNKEALWGKA